VVSYQGALPPAHRSPRPKRTPCFARRSHILRARGDQRLKPHLSVATPVDLAAPMPRPHRRTPRSVPLAGKNPAATIDDLVRQGKVRTGSVQLLVLRAD